MLRLIGTIVDAHGLKGELKVRFISEQPEWVSELKTIYIINSDEELIPLDEAHAPISLTGYRKTNELWILRVDSVSDRTQAEALKHKKVYVNDSFFTTSEGSAPYLLELKNYQVILGEKTVGRVQGFLETPAHSLILLETPDGNQFEIPWVDAFIKEILRSERKILMDFPEELMSEEFKVK